MAAGVQQNGSGNPCAGQTPIWGVCYDSVNPPTDQGQAYGISTSNSGQLGTIYSLQSLQSNACAETNCSNSCSPNYCRRNSTSGGNSSEINEFDDIVVVEQNESQTAKNFCCAPYTQFTIETQTTSVIGPTSGVYNSNNFESPTGYQLPGNYSNNIYRYSDGGECNYGKNIVKCTEKVIIIVGCTDPNASNYNAEANQAGKCEYPTIGCKDVDASNYDANASENCENFECCKYEDEIRDPIDCGNTLKQSKLEVEINTINSKLQSLKNQRIEIIDEQNNGFIPVTNSGYDSYIPYTNINADITDANTNEIFETSTNEGVYRKYIATNITGDIGTDFNSIDGNPDLSDSSRWIPIIDGNGVVSFVLNDVDNDNNDTLTLSHNTQENAGADLYKQFCTSKGYVFNRFILENGRQIPVTTNPNNTYTETDNTTQKCVDSKYITCDEVADVKMVFASNEWSGFYLPEDDGDTDVEISMDVMVKFNADTLLKECIKGDCGIPFIDINSTYDTACKNYVVFVNNDQDIKDIKTSKRKSLSVDSETGQGKWIYGSEDIQTWQRTGLQNEPNVECCETGMLGEIVNSKEYLNNGKTLNFDNLNISENSQLNSDRKDYLNIEKKYKSIISAVNDCDNVEYAEYVYRGCESNYSELITTETICSITPPDDCLGYTTLLQDYEVMINQLVLVDDSLTICINEYKFLQNEISEIDEEIKEKSSEKNKKGKELSEIQSSHKDQITKCENSLGKLRSQKKENQALLSNENSKDNPNYLIIISLQTKINEIEREIEDKELECYQTNRNHNITIENINADIDELNKCIKDLEYYKEQLRESIESKQCCLALGKEINEFKTTVKNNEYNAVLEGSLSCYKKWEDDLNKSYDRYNEEISDSGNVLNFMKDIIIDVSLEVDNSIGTIQNNRVTKYTTLDSYTADINPVWEFDPDGGYTGVLLEGSESSINIVKDSVNVDLIADGTTEGATRIFEPQWQKIKFTLDEGQCDNLRNLYPNKQFFIGLSIKNEKNCETTLLVDNIQINTDVNEIKRIYSANNCPSFDLSCVIDDRKSWVFSDGGVTTKYSVSNNYSEALSTDKKTLTFPKPQERYSGNLEYRYTDYSVNHSKLVLNSKGTSFRIDPANAIECDVYNFWQEIDCDECNTLFSCTTATTLTYTNPTGGTLPLSGTPVPEYSNGIIYDKYNEGGSGFSDRIQNILLQPDGKLIVLASSSSPEYNGTQFGGIIRLNADGSVDNTFNSGTGFNNGAREAVLLSNGKIVVIHRSSTYDGTPIGSVNRFNSDGTLDSTFNVANASFNGNGLHISVQSDGKYIVSGNFIQYGGVSVPDGMIRLNLDGTWDNTFNTGGSGFGPSGFDTDIYVLSDDTIIAAGSTTTYNGNPIPRMVKLDSNGSEVVSFTTNIGTGFNSAVSNVLILSSGKLIVSGSFTDFNGNTVGKIVRLNSDGTYDGTFNSGTGFDDTVSYVIEQLDGKLITGGRFTQFNGSDVPDGLIRLNSDGSIDSTFNSGGYGLGPDITPGGSNNSIKGMILLDNNDIIVAGGYWDTYNGTDVPNNLIRLTAPGKNNSFDCDELNEIIEVLYGKEWLRKLDIELNDYDLARNMSFSVMNDTKDKPKGSQKVSNESSINEDFKDRNINNYDVSYFLPKSLGVGFDIQKSDCNSDIIEIKKYNEDVYTLISEETDGTLGFYSYTADTNDICELTSFVDEQCCNRVSDRLNYTFKINKPNYGWEDGACRWKKADAIENNCDSDCSYYGTQLEETKFIYSGASGVTLSSTCVDTPVCIKPLDYLDKQPNEVNIKPNFDTMVLSNLIDVKSRQVISDYPMLRLFYNQYLNANGCGASITNRLDYNTTFEVMDLIGDYWTDIIEQVVPATTIWDGHNNSGKVYRNTLFDQNKFPYKRYVLNYYDGECEINEITRDAIAINTGSTINLTESCLRGECFGSNYIECIASVKKTEERIEYLKGRLIFYSTSSDPNKDTIIQDINDDIIEIESDLAKQKEKCEDIKENVSENQSALSESNNCDDISEQLNDEENRLKEKFVVGTLSYERQLNFVYQIRGEYESCKRKSNIDITQYTTMFITQMYDSNEYEGDVNVSDGDWDSDVELLHACGSMEYKCPDSLTTVLKPIDINGYTRDLRVFIDGDGSYITNEECCTKLSGDLIIDDNDDKYCESPA